MKTNENLWNSKNLAFRVVLVHPRCDEKQILSKSKGFSDRVVYGMLTSSFFSTLVGVYLPGKYCILQSIDIKFSKPVYIDDILTITGKVSYINEAYKQLEIKAVIINQDNKKVSKATIKVGGMDE